MFRLRLSRDIGLPCCPALLSTIRCYIPRTDPIRYKLYRAARGASRGVQSQGILAVCCAHRLHTCTHALEVRRSLSAASDNRDPRSQKVKSSLRPWSPTHCVNSRGCGRCASFDLRPFAPFHAPTRHLPGMKTFTPVGQSGNVYQMTFRHILPNRSYTLGSEVLFVSSRLVVLLIHERVDLILQHRCCL